MANNNGARAYRRGTRLADRPSGGENHARAGGAAEQDLPIGQAVVKITLELGQTRTTTLVPPLVCLSINYYKLSSMRLCSKSLTTCTRMYHVYCSEVIKKNWQDAVFSCALLC